MTSNSCFLNIRFFGSFTPKVFGKEHTRLRAAICVWSGRVGIYSCLLSVKRQGARPRLGSWETCYFLTCPQCTVSYPWVPEGAKLSSPKRAGGHGFSFMSACYICWMPLYNPSVPSSSFRLCYHITILQLGSLRQRGKWRKSQSRDSKHITLWWLIWISPRKHVSMFVREFIGEVNWSGRCTLNVNGTFSWAGPGWWKGDSEWSIVDTTWPSAPPPWLPQLDGLYCQPASQHKPFLLVWNFVTTVRKVTNSPSQLQARQLSVPLYKWVLRLSRVRLCIQSES